MWLWIESPFIYFKRKVENGIFFFLILQGTRSAPIMCWIVFLSFFRGRSQFGWCWVWGSWRTSGRGVQKKHGKTDLELLREELWLEKKIWELSRVYGWQWNQEGTCRTHNIEGLREEVPRKETKIAVL